MLRLTIHHTLTRSQAKAKALSGTVQLRDESAGPSHILGIFIAELRSAEATLLPRRSQIQYYKPLYESEKGSPARTKHGRSKKRQQKRCVKRMTDPTISAVSHDVSRRVVVLMPQRNWDPMRPEREKHQRK